MAKSVVTISEIRHPMEVLTPRRTRDGLREEYARPIHTSPAICYNADDFVTEVCIEKADYCRRSHHHRPGVLPCAIF